MRLLCRLIAALPLRVVQFVGGALGVAAMALAAAPAWAQEQPAALPPARVCGQEIAPRAEPDDGWLDVVIAEARHAWDVARAVPRLFSGSIDRARGVSIHRARTASVRSDGPLVFHVDGEAATSAGPLRVRIHPNALRIRV